MKKTIAIIILCFCMAMTLGACKKEGDMIGTMISTVFATDSAKETDTHTNNGTVTDSDGHIGNEEQETADAENDIIPDTTEVTTEENLIDNVM